MARTPRLTSDCTACCWIPLFALRCEEARRPELAARPCALLDPEDARRLWQVSPLARRAGVKPGLTVSQRSEEHTSELQSRLHLVCRLLLEKKKIQSTS